MGPAAFRLILVVLSLGKRIFFIIFAHKVIEPVSMNIIPYQEVKDKIVTLRGQDVILDFAVAELYGVETKRINEAVKKSLEKFPDGYTYID